MTKRAGNPTDFESFLTWEALVGVLSYDPATGEFRWVKSGRLGWIGRLAGTVDQREGYRRIEILGRGFFASRLAHFYMLKRWPSDLIDHKNGNRSDDRWANLRPVTRLQNRHNWFKDRVGVVVELRPQQQAVSVVAAVPKKAPQRGKANDFESFLTQEIVQRLLSYDPATGAFVWRSNETNPMRIRVGQRAGKVSSTGYVDIQIMGRKFRAHRVAWLYMTGRWPKHDVDHINQEKSDNCWHNLREATRAQNALNRGKNANNTSGAKGVYRRPNGKFQAYIGIAGKTKKLGTFLTFGEALNARQDFENANLAEWCTTTDRGVA